MHIRVASAGTGKTAWLCRRFLEHIGRGVPLYRLAGVTFTSKAAAELEVRLRRSLEALAQGEEVYGYRCQPTQVSLFRAAQQQLAAAPLGTIHRFMGQCLRLVAPLVQLDPDFELIGDWDAQLLFEETLRSLQLLGQALPPAGFEEDTGLPWAQACLQLYRQRSLSPQWTAGPGVENQQLLDGFEQVMAAYRNSLGPRRLDLAELELRAVRAAQHPTAAQRLVQRFPFLLIDEFQDVNPVQGAFFAALEAAGCQVEAVGDPKQAVYEFREANLEVFRTAYQQAQQQGQLQPALATSYRHGQVLTRFLNQLTTTLAQKGWGFEQAEAPRIGTVRTEKGRVEVHWISGQARRDLLRQHEARVLAARLAAYTQQFDPQQMAVLVRSRYSLPVLEAALQAEGLPFAQQQGRGLYARNEIRDLYNALRAGLDPRGLALASWLRSPWVGLSVPAIDAVLQASQPMQVLQAQHPQVYRLWQQISQLVRNERPTEAIRLLLRIPLEGGQTYPERLSQPARENLDWLLFEYHRDPPATLELLLQRLDQLRQRNEAPVVPQGGQGIQLLTIHGAKGLEWPLVGLFDLIRNPPKPERGLQLAGGRVLLPGTPHYQPAFESARQRRRQEQFRLLYVATSRAREVLLVSGSLGQDNLEHDWQAAMQEVGLGPDKPRNHPEILVAHHPYRPGQLALPTQEFTSLAPAPWTAAHFPAHAFPPVFSPSALRKGKETPDDLPGLPDPQEGELVPQRSQAVGTLVHYAVGQNWDPDHAPHRHNLEAQEVMFPFDPTERAAIMDEVVGLWRNYRRLLGQALPWPRQEDYPELPLLLPLGKTVWQGVADRVYRVGTQWFLDDYKTDRSIEPGQYHFQLAIYQKALEQAWGVRAQARLVYLRHPKIILLDDQMLREAIERELPLSDQ